MAGYATETALWKMLADLSQQLSKHPYTLPTPHNVVVEGEEFRLTDAAPSGTSPFTPPEGADQASEQALVWALGALVCYASSGHNIFGAQGGAYQKEHPNVQLPVLRKEHSTLTPLVQRCLCYKPADRITLSELHRQALNSLQTSLQKKRQVAVAVNNNSNTTLTADDVWPEQM